MRLPHAPVRRARTILLQRLAPAELSDVSSISYQRHITYTPTEPSLPGTLLPLRRPVKSPRFRPRSVKTDCPNTHDAQILSVERAQLSLPIRRGTLPPHSCGADVPPRMSIGTVWSLPPALQGPLKHLTPVLNSHEKGRVTSHCSLRLAFDRPGELRTRRSPSKRQLNRCQLPTKTVSSEHKCRLFLQLTLMKDY